MRLAHRWGESFAPSRRLKSKSGTHASVYQDESLDASGFSPAALEPLLALASSVPFEEAAAIALSFGLTVSASELERLTRPLGEACKHATRKALQQAAAKPVAPSDAAAKRVFVLEVDGVMVLRRDPGKSLGLEIKTIVLYALRSPAKRRVLCESCEAGELPELILGLLREAGVTANDTLVGVGDGAAWVEELLDLFCAQRIADIYHAAGYLELLMLALNWDEPQRAQQRRAWCQGEISAAAWLDQHLPEPDVWLGWDDQQQQALRYLESRLQHMDYPRYKANGWPIGSGQVEGANKWVIGARMKRSGMIWSRAGAARMASLRARACSSTPLVSFHPLRHQAFPPPTPPALQTTS